MTPIDTLAIGVAVLGACALIIVLAICFKPETGFRCDGCGDTLPDGFVSADEGKFYCRACTRRLGLKPWYRNSCMDNT